MLEIRKISENFYLIDGEYTASNFNDAVIIANQNKGKIKNFELGYMEISLWRKIKNKLNLPFLLLESWMWCCEYTKFSFSYSFGGERCWKWEK